MYVNGCWALGKLYNPKNDTTSYGETGRAMRRAPGARGGSGDSLGAPRPSSSCQNGKPDEREDTHPANHNNNPGPFDDGKPSEVKCHDARLGGRRETAL